MRTDIRVSRNPERLTALDSLHTLRYTMSTAVARVRLDPETLPTAKQVECLKAIRVLTKRMGHPPAIRDVSAYLGLSPMGARPLIMGCVSRGLLTPPKVVARTTMRITRAGGRWA